MRVDIWFDYACPFCYIGKRRFEAAISEFQYKDQIDIHFHSHQLQPDAPKNSASTIHELIAAKYGTTIDHAKTMNNHISEQARDVGLRFRFDTLIPTNTIDAHRLTYYAREQGKSNDIIERIFKAYLSDSLHIGDPNILLNLATEIGLPKAEVNNVLNSDKYKDLVYQDMQTGRKIGIQGVPFFVFNNTYAISGAQSSETLKDVLQDVWEEEQESIVAFSSKKQSISEYCTGDGCCNS